MIYCHESERSLVFISFNVGVEERDFFNSSTFCLLPNWPQERKSAIFCLTAFRKIRMRIAWSQDEGDDNTGIHNVELIAIRIKGCNFSYGLFE